MLHLTDPVKYLKGVGPARAEIFAELGIRTVGDLLFYFPRDLSHLPSRTPVADCRTKVEQVVTVGGVLERCRWHGRGFRPMLSARLADNSGAIDVTWFNCGWLKGKFGEGDNVILSGKLRPGRYGPQLTNPKIAKQEAPAADQLQSGLWEPVYPATAKISTQQIQRVVQRNLPGMLRLVEEFFPPQYLRRRKLIDRWLAVGWMHFPAMASSPIEVAASAPVSTGGSRVDPVAGSESRPGTVPGSIKLASSRREDNSASILKAGPQSYDEPPLALEPHLPAETVQARHQTARRRLAWDEAFLFQLGLAIRRQTRQTQLHALPLPCDDRIRQRILRRFPFPLTAAQLKVIDQISADLAKPVPMNRLLQGDVGSGKTVVALFAALLAVAHGCQAAIMAPTEILASQHHDRISQYLRGSRVRWALVTGSLPVGERRRINEQLAGNQLDLVVGTSALISQGVQFARLGLVVIDEQHKFGVQQRSQLRDARNSEFGIRNSELRKADQGAEVRKQSEHTAAAPIPNSDLSPNSEFRIPNSEFPSAPHTLVMTATPIPRSLALTVFGDLAVSVIDESPPGRGQTQTRIVSPSNRDVAWDFIEARLAQGGQAFIVCPRVGATEPAESTGAAGPADSDGQAEPAEDATEDRQTLASAEQTFSDLKPRFEKFGIALVHGQMARDRQRAVLADFAAGRVRALVATTVVEVGVDVARASVMAVLSAERFGLAQLHQLRGRIGRSADIKKSYCLLFVSTEGSADRLGIMERTADGFRIAEEDLARRGPGQFFGLAQHGLPEFQFVDLAKDLALLGQVRQDAFEIIDQDPALAQSSHAVLRRHLTALYGQSLQLVDAG